MAEPFRTSFARTAAEHGVVPLVQIEPTGVSLAAIAAGKYDGYLSSYADAVRSYRPPGHLELRPRDERGVVFLELPAHVPDGVCRRLAAYRHRVPRESAPAT